ncbi:CDP-glycerol glycerophosphotransferase family protein [Bacillus inaquosorum]|uniref:CDP-glycerol glycerophosphotransferase family protein n=1 Tax=Bacillus inaquosorum TaxID=483913 RepID=UPI00227E743B|nr:CDP-glycerol glycerophosphotransferase family protein [Bacillus inaquosorum]MCY7961985.1 CDP-glycerol glycerophosphotransferase family protein [Bacillus inaquosorum]MCY7978039.1 CDP-glycerol glycerophosphotransferase family protein [Bacillus inaquosorum]MCY8282033.1 CDP-glycerol glycerophosphotransferase family protein [Bacillus inaquosorum]MCY8695193.1 CDP-glycerol glycerophosphotransferase family protein [Bacillus inaquosorum]MCY8753179.1 CDP-glycerol glycerophosphotransferase family prot
MKSFILNKCRSLLVRAYSVLFKIFALLPRNNKLILFESYSGKQFSCNPRAIYEYLQENKDQYDYKLIWSIDKRYLSALDGVDAAYIKRFSLKWIWYMATAKYWITNSRLPLWIPKPKNTLYVQTWHGTPLKKLANDMDEVHMPGTTTEKYKQNFLQEASKWDYLISPNAYSTEIFKRAFQFKKQILETGYPRNDILYSLNKESLINKVKQELGIGEDKKIILYAPTWRDNEFKKVGQYKFKLQFDLEELKKEFGDSVVILLRMHYLVSENFNLEEHKGFALDVSSYRDIRDLYLISDLLVTDYSSVFFDYINLKRPIIFFVYDLPIYRDAIRGFYFNFQKEAPGYIVETKEELISQIKSILNNPTLNSNYDTYYNLFCKLEDGQASKRVINRIFD